MQKKLDLKAKLKATIEANRIARLGIDIVYEKLEEYRKDLTELRGKRNIWLETIVIVLERKIDEKEEKIETMEYGNIAESF